MLNIPRDIFDHLQTHLTMYIIYLHACEIHSAVSHNEQSLQKSLELLMNRKNGELMSQKKSYEFLQNFADGTENYAGD